MAGFIDNVDVLLVCVGFGIIEGLLGAVGNISEVRLDMGIGGGGLLLLLLLDKEEDEGGGFLAEDPMAPLAFSCNRRSSARLRAIASSTTSVGGGPPLPVGGGPTLLRGRDLMLPGVVPPRCFLAIGGPLPGDRSKLLFCIGLFIIQASFNCTSSPTPTGTRSRSCLVLC